MDVFRLREQLTQDYADYASSFIHILDPRIHQTVEQRLSEGAFWPDPLIQLNPSFERGSSVDELVRDGVLHPECGRIFRRDKKHGAGTPLNFHRHQTDALMTAREGHNYILTTGTGSGKSLSYIVPIVDHVLRRGSGGGVQAIIVYPMNALANSQAGELEKFLQVGYPQGQSPVTYARYTGQEREEERQRIIAHPPDILLTNYVMLELLMTRPRERTLVEGARGLRFLVLDELHTYRGRQGADVALLVRRVRNRLETEQPIQCVGTSATLASEGTYDEQRQKIAEVGTQMFGAPVYPEHIIGETLRRATPERDPHDPAFQTVLRSAMNQQDDIPTPATYHEFVSHPLSSWIESTFGVQMRDGLLTRSTPRSILGDDGAARLLSNLTGADVEDCVNLIQRWLLAGYKTEPNPETGFRPFAFRLHQFISPGDTVYASIEPEETRYLTLNGQMYVPGQREKGLFPLCFCRECGQEYYVVRLIDHLDGGGNGRKVMPRDFRDQLNDEEGEAGYLYLSQRYPWSDDFDDTVNRLPDDWLEERKSGQRVKPGRRDSLPRPMWLLASGEEDANGQHCAFVPTPFMFCLNCGVSYAPRQGDFGKLASLSSEGRSSATTILSLSAIRSLRESDLDEKARKLLSFTDNRQDASLQAGHFNDFIELGLLRGAIFRAVKEAGAEGLSHDYIAQRVFEALNLPLELYTDKPDLRFQPLHDTQKALRQVLGYRIYRDLRRGWRVTSPNLEQCGLLEIDYISLTEVCEAEDVWEHCHPALATASPQTRSRIARVLLDYLRRELAINVDYLEKTHQERIQQQSNQRLIAPWAIDEDELMEAGTIVFPRSRTNDDDLGNRYLSARGGFGLYLRRAGTFPEYDRRAHNPLDLVTTDSVISQLLQGLSVAGLVTVVVEPRDTTDVPGYQLKASAMVWREGTGERGFHDPIRVPREPEAGTRPNPFFTHFYHSVAQSLIGLEAHEHTAQVPNDDRIKREIAFREGRLPILYCSPTMELGVDIAELNVVNMRNVPPTPANYAQRSGRAGRSGQPALVFTYCSSGSPHDQYFFRRPERMVVGAVAPPRLDLTNSDLLRAHIHAVWLAETRVSLGESLRDILDLTNDPPSLELLPEIRQPIESVPVQSAARQRAAAILATIPELSPTEADALLGSTMQSVVQAFDTTCNRWRDLYRAARRQAEMQGRIVIDASRDPSEKSHAVRLRREAEAQLKLLTEIDSLAQSDFYSYRYFATEGFLPGYSFPRLPISAFIPARRTRQRDEFLSRPRFLAISEFGPRAIIYHEGSRYLINQIIMPLSMSEDDEPLTGQAKQCGNCGYLHPIRPGVDYDLCERCGRPLDPPITPLLRLQNVVTRRRDRINSDEEERLRLGYEIRTGVRFVEKDGRPAAITARVVEGETELIHLTYAPAATLWRINLGWARRKDKQRRGFVLDVERGYWARNEQLEEDKDDPMSARTRRVIPFVEDSRNCLLFEPGIQLELGQMASLQAALKRAIEARYQLEDNELAAEPLPDAHDRRLILFYESAEGGAGVLRRLVDEPGALSEVARIALDLCHFNPDTGEDERHAKTANEDCEAACYDCLLSYGNQREHPILDRMAIRDLLWALMTADVLTSPTTETRESHLDMLLRLCDSDLEREWLIYLYERGYRLPDSAQPLFERCRTRPDFAYSDHQMVIYVDGSHHDYPNRQERDRRQSACMENAGYNVIRFGYRGDWDAVMARYPHIFGGER